MKETSICLECKLHQDTCCTNVNAPLTIKEIRNYVNKGYKLKDFAVAGNYIEENVKDNEDWWINSMALIRNKHYKTHTRRKENGDCFFLEKKGCKLGKERPLSCKIYPFWPTDGKVSFEDGEEDYCYFIKKAYSVSEGLKLINETRNTIKSYFEEIKEDCINNQKKHKKITKLLENRGYTQPSVV